MVFLPPTRCRDDEQRAPFAQVRLARLGVGTRGHALVRKDGFFTRFETLSSRNVQMQKHTLAKNVQRIVIVQHVSVICANRNPCARVSCAVSNMLTVITGDGRCRLESQVSRQGHGQARPGRDGCRALGWRPDPSPARLRRLPISAARATALQACSAFADEWGYAYRACMTSTAKEE